MLTKYIVFSLGLKAKGGAKEAVWMVSVFIGIILGLLMIYYVMNTNAINMDFTNIDSNGNRINLTYDFSASIVTPIEIEDTILLQCRGHQIMNFLEKPFYIFSAWGAR